VTRGRAGGPSAEVREMKKVKLVTDILKANENLARLNREMFDSKGVFAVNMMSSPGSGKTTILERSLPLLDGLAVGVIEGDIDTTRDADRVAAAAEGAQVVQINTQGACHLDANMIASAVRDMELDTLDLLIVENVGNLVCPAGFDLGEDVSVMVLSVTEGNDKPRKYPAMFRKSSAVLLNKIDLLAHTDFDLEELRRDLSEINPDAELFPMSARTCEGVAEWCAWLKGRARTR